MKKATIQCRNELKLGAVWASGYTAYKGQVMETAIWKLTKMMGIAGELI